MLRVKELTKEKEKGTGSSEPSRGTRRGSVLSFSKVSTIASRAALEESAIAVSGHFLGLSKQASIKPRNVSSADKTMFVSLFELSGYKV